MSGEGVPDIYVAAPHAHGKPQDSYQVSPVREFSIAQAGFEPWPSTLATGSHGDILVASVTPTGNEIQVFRGGPSGSPAPVRTISGPRTGLGSCAGFDACDHLSVAYSALTIEGSRTGLAGKVITGIADSQLTGDIYVMVKGAQFFAPGDIEVFGRLASGDARPLRRFTDSSSRFAGAGGIAVAS